MIRVIFIVTLFMKSGVFLPSIVFAEPSKDVYVREKHENFRIAPQGKKIGVLRKGAKLQVIDKKGKWLKVKVEGWIWKPSTSLVLVRDEESIQTDWERKWGTLYKPGECQEKYVPGDSRPMCKTVSMQRLKSRDKSRRCQEVYVPGDSRPMCRSSSRSRSSSAGSAPNVNSVKEVNCLVRLVTERKQGKNTMSDQEIADLCEYLF